MAVRGTLKETAARDAKLIEMWNAGMTAEVIARRLRIHVKTCAGRVAHLRQKGVPLESRNIAQTTIPWTPERYAKVKELADAGRSAGYIASALGGVSRSAIVGVCYRRRWQLRGNGDKTVAPPTIWTDAMVSRAKAMFFAGEAYSAIAKALGIPVNAARHKSERLGWLAQRPASIRPRGGGSSKGRRFKISAEAMARRNEARAVFEKQSPWAPLPDSTPRPWIERERGQCAWPIGEAGDIHSCCKPVHTGSWCEEHHALGRVPIDPSKWNPNRVWHFGRGPAPVLMAAE